MNRLTARLLGLAAVAALPATARAFQVEYVSPHPVPHKFGDGFCYIDVPHTHNYRPDDPRLYREARGQLYFVGDPTPFGYDGPHYAYYGAHPVFEAEMRFGQPVFCYIKGPHVHWYQPPPQAPYELSGGAYWYVGRFPTVYYQERPRYAVINQAYASMPYTRPQVDVAVAPAAVRGEISLGGPGWRASAVVAAPPAPVVVPAPPPPGPAVQIGVDINLGGPAPVVGVPGGPPDPPRHDHGRHRGSHDRRRPPRFVDVPPPFRGPLLQRQRKPAPVPRLAPTARPAPTGRAAAQGRSDNRQLRR